MLPPDQFQLQHNLSEKQVPASNLGPSMVRRSRLEDGKHLDYLEF